MDFTWLVLDLWLNKTLKLKELLELSCGAQPTSTLHSLCKHGFLGINTFRKLRSVWPLCKSRLFNLQNLQLLLLLLMHFPTWRFDSPQFEPMLQRRLPPFPSGCLWGMMIIWLMWMKIRIMPMMETLLIVIIIMMMMMMTTLTDPYYTLASASLFSSLNPWYIILQGGPFRTNLPRRGSGAVLPWGVVRHLRRWHDEMMIAAAHDTISVKYDIKEINYIINHPSKKNAWISLHWRWSTV